VITLGIPRVNYKMLAVRHVEQSVKMYKILTLFLVFTAIGMGYAYAAPVTVDVPHEYTNVDPCVTITNQYGGQNTQCLFVGANPNPNNLSTATEDGCLDGYSRDYETQECKLDEVIVEEAKKAYEEFVKETMDKLTPTEKIIVQLEQEELRKPLDAADKQLLEKLKRLGAVCRYDIEQIQTYEEFDIPTDKIYDPETNTWSVQIYKNYDLVSIDKSKHILLNKIDRAVEACIAQGVLSTKIIGAGTTNKIVDGFGSQRYHAEHTYLDNIYANGKHFYAMTAASVNAQQNVTPITSIRDTICNNEQFTAAFKEQHACPKPEYVDTIVRPHIYNPFGDEGRVLLDQFATYQDGDMREQEQMVKQKAIDRGMGKLERLK
jgi:hypothetical protein